MKKIGTEIDFPAPDDKSVVQPPDNPSPGSFYNDEVEGLIWIPEEYDTNGEPMKVIVSDENISIILESEVGKTGARYIGWMGFINSYHQKKIAGSIEITPANIPELRMMGEVNRITVIEGGEVRIFTEVELLLNDYTQLIIEEGEPFNIQFIATDDPILKKAEAEDTVPVEGIEVVET